MKQSLIAIIVHNIEIDELVHSKEIIKLLYIKKDGQLTINEIKRDFSGIFP